MPDSGRGCDKVINKLFRYFLGIVINPKETTTRILEEKFGWKHILLVLIILTLIKTLINVE